MQDLKMYMFLFSEQEANSDESLKKRPKVDQSGEEKSVEMGERDHGAKAKIPWSVIYLVHFFFVCLNCAK